MMRLLFKSVVVVVLVMGIGNYLVYLKTGQMPLRDMYERADGNWLADMRAFFSPEKLTRDAKNAVNDLTIQYREPEPIAPTKVYKWTDADGQVHFGDKPQSATAEQVDVKIQNAISAPVDVRSAERGDAEAQPSASGSTLDKARTAAELMQQRIQAQEQMQ